MCGIIGNRWGLTREKHHSAIAYALYIGVGAENIAKATGIV